MHLCELYMLWNFESYSSKVLHVGMKYSIRGAAKDDLPAISLQTFSFPFSFFNVRERILRLILLYVLTWFYGIFVPCGEIFIFIFGYIDEYCILKRENRRVVLGYISVSSSHVISMMIKNKKKPRSLVVLVAGNNGEAQVIILPTVSSSIA